MVALANKKTIAGRVGGNSGGIDDLTRQIRDIGMNTFDNMDILDDLQSKMEESKQYIEELVDKPNNMNDDELPF